MPGRPFRLLHISDLHFGPPLHPLGPAALEKEVERLQPNLVVVSGDLTQRAKRSQFRAARAFLDRLGVPFLAIPGNHDIPLYPIHRRIFAPYRQFRKWIEPSLEPEVLKDGVAVLGVNTAAPYLVVEGHAALGRAERWAERLNSIPPGHLKIVAAHHPMLAPPGEEPEHLLYQRRKALSLLSGAGCRILLGGHHHVSFVANAGYEFPESDGLWVLHSGTSSSTRGRGPDQGSRSFNLLEVSIAAVRLSRHVARGDADFAVVEERDLPVPPPVAVPERQLICPFCRHQFTASGFRSFRPKTGRSDAYVKCPHCQFKFPRPLGNQPQPEAEVSEILPTEPRPRHMDEFSRPKRRRHRN